MSATTPPVAVALGVIGLSSRTSPFIGRDGASTMVWRFSNLGGGDDDLRRRPEKLASQKRRRNV